MTDGRRIAMVTGAATGIGEAVAAGLAATGWHVVMVGRRRAALEESAARIGGETTVRPADVSDAAAVEAVFGGVRETFGRLDLLFNNAGVNLPPTPFEDVAATDWRQVIDVNLTGAFLCAQAAYRLMKAQAPQGGRIINNGSISATAPRPEFAAYTASKHGMLGLTRTIALEGRRHNIACGQIDIGNTDTAMASGMAKGMLQADFSRRTEPTFHVRHVVDAVLYMAGLPLEANVQSLTVLATTMPYVGRG